MRTCAIILVTVLLAGCGVELLTTTAITSDLQAQQLKSMKGQIKNASDTTAKINIQRAIDTYAAEKGRYPASLDELAPGYIPSVPRRPDGQPYGYDATVGKVLENAAPASVAPVGPTANDNQKLQQIWAAVDQYGRTVGYYPPSLQALVPTYLQAVPKTDSGQDFCFDPTSGALYHPAQLAQQTAPGAPAPPVASATPRPSGAGVAGGGPMGEVMTGIGVQNQLNSMSNGGTNAVGGYARRSIGGATDQHNAQQERALKELGN